MLGRRNLLQTITYVKNTAGSDLRRVLGGFGEYSGNALHKVPVPLSFLNQLLCATVRGHYSELE